MIFWVFAIVLTGAALGFLLWPMLGRQSDADHDPTDTAGHDVAVYRSQLAEIARDRENGRLTPEEAEAARVEIGRRLIAADDRRTDRSAPVRAAGALRPVGIFAVVAIIGAVAFGTYFKTGAPGVPDNPLAAREAERQLAQNNAGSDASMPGSLAEAAGRLRQRLATNAGNLDDWMLLGRTEIMSGNYAGAAQAFEKAMELAPGSPEIVNAYAESLVLWADGTVTDRALRLFQQAIALDPTDPRARFYIAEAALQDGRLKDALDGYTALLGDTPADAPWLPAVRGRAISTAETLGIDISDQLAAVPEAPVANLPDAAPGPTQEDIAAAQEMSQEDRTAMIRGMVDGLAERLEENPMDFEGWMRLIRSRMVLGEQDDAQVALNKALEIFQRAPVPKRMLAEAAAELGLEVPESPADESSPGASASTSPQPGPTQDDIAAAQEMAPEDRQAMIEGMVAGLAERLETETPDDLQGWLRLARSYDVLGNTEGSMNALVRAAELAEKQQPHLLPSLLIDQARLRRAVAGNKQTPETVSLMQRVATLQPDNIEALWFLGLDALNKGDKTTARDYFDRAATVLPQGSDERNSLEAEIKRLLGI